MAQRHDARLVELVVELGGDDIRFLFVTWWRKPFRS